MKDRSNALLTNSQREKLAAGTESGGEHSRQYRQRVRERTLDGTKDLALLFENMEERDIEQVFYPDRDSIEKTHELLNAVVDSLHDAGLHRSRGRTGYWPELMDALDRLDRVEQELADIEGQLDLRQGETDSKVTDGLPVSEKDPFKIELKNLREQQEELLEDLLDRLDHTEQNTKGELEALDESLQQLHKIPLRDLEGDIADRIENIRKDFHHELDTREKVLNLVHEVRFEIEDGHLPLNSAQKLEQMVRKEFGKQDDPVGGRYSSEPFQLLRWVRRRIKQELERSEFDPGLRDDVVEAIAFYLRVSDVLGTSTEELVEEAMVRMYEQEHPNEVVDHAVFSFEAEDRDTAADRASEDIDRRRLSNAELRALVDTSPTTLVNQYADSSVPSEGELKARVVKNPGVLEEGLEIVDDNPRSPGSAHVPDLVAENANGNIVVIEVKRTLDDPGAIGSQMEKLIAEYGGSERVRGIVAVPDAAAEAVPVSLNENDQFDVKVVRKQNK